MTRAIRPGTRLRRLAFACLMSLAVGASAAPLEFDDPRAASVRMLSFKNGPTVLLAPDSLAGAVHVGLWFEAGSLNDPPGAAGLAYVVSRWAFRFPSDLQRSLEEEGASFGFAVSPDMSFSAATLPAEELARGLEALLSRLSAAQRSDAELREAIERTRAERAQRLQGSPLAFGLERIGAATFPGHGYGSPPSGDDAQLGRITAEIARKDLETRFAPARALITIVGRFDPAEATSMLERRLGPSGPGRAGARSGESVRFAPPIARELAGEAKVPIPILLMAWRGPADRDPDSPAVEALAHLLIDGSPSWLETRLPVDSPLLRLQGSYDRRKEASLLVLAAPVQAVIDTSQIEEALASLVEGIARDSIPAADLERARRRVEARYLESAETARGRAESLASAQLLDGDWRAWEKRVEQVRSLTPESVRKAAAKLLDPSRRAVVWIDSAPPPDAPGEGR